MNDTWRFITVVALLVVVGALLPLVADAAGVLTPVPELIRCACV
jgi:hypothetical protein